MHRECPSHDQTLHAGSPSELASSPAAPWRPSRRRLIQVAAGTSVGLSVGGLVQSHLARARASGRLAHASEQEQEEDGPSIIVRWDAAVLAALLSAKAGPTIGAWALGRQVGALASNKAQSYIMEGRESKLTLRPPSCHHFELSQQ
jgi:hypothetical protein